MGGEMRGESRFFRSVFVFCTQWYRLAGHSTAEYRPLFLEWAGCQRMPMKLILVLATVLSRP